MSERSDTAGYLGWFFLGAAVGAAAALLLTPKTGAETRELRELVVWRHQASSFIDFRPFFHR